MCNTEVNGTGASYRESIVTISAPSTTPQDITILEGLTPSFSYDIRVKAGIGDRNTDNFVESANWHNETGTTITTLANGPTDVTVTERTPTGVHISWTGVARSSIYSVQIARVSALPAGWVTVTDQDNATNNAQAIVNLPTQNQYAIRVNATLANNTKTDWGYYATNTALTQPVGAYSYSPITRSSLTTPSPSFSASTFNSIPVSWSKIPGANQYEVRYKKRGGLYSEEPEVASGTDLSIPNLEQGTDYTIQLRALNTSGIKTVSAWSPETTRPTRAVDIPAALRSTSITHRSIALSWGAISGSNVRYDIQYSTNEAFLNNTQQQPNLSTTSTTLTDLAPGVVYYIRVRAQQGSVEGHWSESIQRTTQMYDLNLRVKQSSISDTSIEVEWDAIPDSNSAHSGFEVRHARELPGGGTDLRNAQKTTVGPADTSAVVRGLRPRELYVFKINILYPNNIRSSQVPQVPITAQTIRSAPPLTPNPITNSLTPGQLTFSWRPIQESGTSISRYEVQYGIADSNNAVSEWTLLTPEVSGSSSSATISNLLTKTRYIFRVRGWEQDARTAWAQTTPHETSGVVTTNISGITDIKTNELTLQLSPAFSGTIDRSTTSAFTTSTALSVTGKQTTYRATGLTPNTTYYFRVRGTTRVASARTLKSVTQGSGSSPLPAPTNLRLTGTNTASWNAVTGATSYEARLKQPQLVMSSSYYFNPNSNERYGNALDYILNPTTGTASVDSNSTRIQSIKSITAIGTKIYATFNEDDALYTINTTNGQPTRLGGTGIGHITSIGTTLYTVDTNHLYTVNTTTGAKTRRGTTPFGLSAVNCLKRIEAVEGRDQNNRRVSIPSTIYVSRHSSCAGLHSINPTDGTINKSFNSRGITNNLLNSAKIGNVYYYLDYSGSFYLRRLEYNPTSTASYRWTGISGNVGSSLSINLGRTGQTPMVAINNTLYVVETRIQSPILHAINKDTGANREVGGIIPDIQDYASINNTVYIIDDNNNALYTRTSTGYSRVGSATNFGVSETNPTGLVAIGSTLYMVGNSTHKLYTLSTTTGRAQAVESSTTNFGHTRGYNSRTRQYTYITPTDLAAIGSTLYMLTTSKLYTLSTSTGVASEVGSTAGSGLAAIGNTLYMVGSGGLYTLSTTTGRSQAVSPSTNNFGFTANAPSYLSGLAYIPTEPQVGSLVARTPTHASFTIATPIQGAEYTIEVRAKNASGTSSWSALKYEPHSLTFTNLHSQITPTLSATPATESTVTFSLVPGSNSSTDVANPVYEVQYSPSNQFPTDQSVTIQTTTLNQDITLSNLTAGTRYYIRARQLGVEHWDLPVSPSTSTTKPATISNLRSGRISFNRGTKAYDAQIIWNKPSTPVRVEVQYTTVGGFAGATESVITNPGALTTTLGNLSANQTYYVRVRALGINANTSCPSFQCGDWSSSPISFTTERIPAPGWTRITQQSQNPTNFDLQYYDGNFIAIKQIQYCAYVTIRCEVDDDDNAAHWNPIPPVSASGTQHTMNIGTIRPGTQSHHFRIRNKQNTDTSVWIKQESPYNFGQ